METATDVSLPGQLVPRNWDNLQVTEANRGVDEGRNHVILESTHHVVLS